MRCKMDLSNIPDKELKAELHKREKIQQDKRLAAKQDLIDFIKRSKGKEARQFNLNTKEASRRSTGRVADIQGAAKGGDYAMVEKTVSI